MKTIAKFISAKNEGELQKLFLLIQEINHQQFKVINVYPSGNKVYLWFYGDENTITNVKLKGGK